MIRIYTLAKELAESFDIKLKSSDLAKEIRDLPENSAIAGSIKSHASTIDEEVADRMRKIYAARHAPDKKKNPDAIAAEKKAALDRKKVEEANRREEIKQRRRHLQQAPASINPMQQGQLEIARQQRIAEMQRRQDAQKSGGASVAPPPRPIPVGIPLPKSRLQPIPLPGHGSTPPMGHHRPAPSIPGQPPVVQRPPQPPSAHSEKATPLAPPGPAIKPAALQSSAPPALQAPGNRESERPEGKIKVSPPPPPVSRGGMRADGQPMPPPPPKLGSESPFLWRRSQSVRTSPPPGGARHEEKRGKPQRPMEPSKGGRSGELVIPQIGVMSLKSPPRRGRGAGAGDRSKSHKKKGIKTISRDEFEVKPSKVYGLADEFRRPIAKKRSSGPRVRSAGGRGFKRLPTKPTGPVTLGSMLTVGQFAEKIGITPAELIKQMMLMGQPLTMNQLINPDLCEVLAQEFEVQIVIDQENDEIDIEQYLPEENEQESHARSPVVTIMGHVDHGKTTLLDAYRSSSVVEGEVGGITQHIGAYHVETPRGNVVFLDTPGHAAFTSMRARGADVTDIVILVVAADDGVMPQTIEAIHHARDAGVPIIVAINKIDLPDASSERVRTELMRHQILPEELGGDNIFVELSAKTGQNLDQLLEMVLLQAEMLELKADPSCNADGIVIESHLDPMRGAVATVLIKRGTLHHGDVFVVGDQNGRVRGMINDRGRQIREAGPSIPVEVTGLTGAPDAGEHFLVINEERIAREIADRRNTRRRMKELSAGTGVRHVTLENLHDIVSEGKLKELKVILKADVQGSLEAISQSLEKLSNQEVKVRILHRATGGVTESDVTLANASDAIVIGFNVRPDPAARALVESTGVDLKTYQIIYELIDDFRKAIVGMLDKRHIEVVVGHVEIRKLYKISRIGTIAGCMVLDGEVKRQSRVRLLRDSVVVYDGKIASLRRVKDDVQKVAAGFECGITLENFDDIKEGDIIEVYVMEERPSEIAGTLV